MRDGGEDKKRWVEQELLSSIASHVRGWDKTMINYSV